MQYQYIRTDADTHVYTHTYTCTHTYTYVYIYTQIYTYACLSVPRTTLWDYLLNAPRLGLASRPEAGTRKVLGLVPV